MKVNARLVYLAGPLSFTGVQLISPTLPLLRSDLGLSATQLALVMSVYLLPAALFALPAGLLADRWGRRRMMGWSLIVFGAVGLAYFLVDGSVPLLLTLRFVQGAAFASILPLTITILGDSYGGLDLVRAQGYRTVSLGLGETVLPVIGGYLALFGWEFAWAVQALALPLGIAVLMLMRDQVESGRRTLLANGRELLDLFRRPHILAVEWIGIQRMFVKFALLGFLPVYLVEFRDLDTGFAGLLLGASAFTGVAVAAFAERLMRRGTIRGWVTASLFLASGSVLGYVIAPTAPAVLVAGILFGAADGLSSVLSNSLVAIATQGDVRASFVAATGAARNLAKAVSPAVVGGLVLLLPLGGALAAIGIAGMLGSAAGRALGPIEARLRSAEAG